VNEPVPVEIACDESGYEGEKLIGSTTDVFAHASVLMDTESAGRCVQETRDRIRSPATEYKANHVLRQKNRSVLLWLLGPDGPLLGNAHVYLVDKAYLVVRKVVDLLLGDPARAASMELRLDPATEALALALYRDGPASLGAAGWASFLAAANDLMRTRERPEAPPLDSFFDLVAATVGAVASVPAVEILARMVAGRVRAAAFRAPLLLGHPEAIPTLDPLFPAILRAADQWCDGTAPVTIVHDRQNVLWDGRVARLVAAFGKPPAGRLAEVRLVDSFVDQRVQVADYLAGVARKISSDELNGRGNAELVELLRPYVDGGSVWGDGPSWERLGKAAPGTARTPG
jgi:hypothetical protein